MVTKDVPHEIDLWCHLLVGFLQVFPHSFGRLPTEVAPMGLSLDGKMWVVIHVLVVGDLVDV